MKTSQKPNPAKIDPHLGLVCITESDEVRYRTITRTRLLSLSQPAREQQLLEIYRANLSRLAQALEFCHRHKIRLYRLTSDLFPQADSSAGQQMLKLLEPEAARIGARAKELAIRLVMHPDQFVVLSSDSTQVLETSIAILLRHARTFEMLDQPESSWAAMTIHGGKRDRAERLIKVVQGLPNSIRRRLTLENDERAYSAQQMLELCRRAQVPMIFDAHHHICYEKLASYEDPSVAEILQAARSTWPEPAWQLVHLSNGREFFNDMRHSDLISVVPSCYADAPWIEIEAKAKERAIAALRAQGFGLN